MEQEINIIYFIWLNKDRNWSVIIEGQLFDIISSNILEKSYLNIIISCENNDLVCEAVNLINKYLINHIGKYNIELYNENCYEYYGIRKLYECAKKNPKSIYIYFHTKGMFNWYNNNLNIRSEDEVNLTNYLIHGWKDILNVFKNYGDINRIGLVPSVGGWIWFNFFYARGDYLITCEEPIKNEIRYYYESWLGSGDQNIGLPYGIYSGDYKKYKAEEAIDIIEKMRQEVIDYNKE